LISTETKSRKTGADCTRRDDHNLVARLTGSSNLKAELFDRFSPDDSLPIGER
jgi:hypothetical protein